PSSFRVCRKTTWSPIFRSDSWMVWPPFVSWTELVIVIVRVQPSAVLSVTSLPLIDVMVMSANPRPPSRPRPGRPAAPMPVSPAVDGAVPLDESPGADEPLGGGDAGRHGRGA